MEERIIDMNETEDLDVYTSCPKCRHGFKIYGNNQLKEAQKHIKNLLKECSVRSNLDYGMDANIMFDSEEYKEAKAFLNEKN